MEVIEKLDLRQVLEQVGKEKNIDKQVLIDALQAAMLTAARKKYGLTADIEADLGDTKYMYVWDDIRIRKTVHFFLMRHTGGNVEDRDDEMEEIRWFPLERALKRAAYRGERDVLARAAELLQ